MKETMEIGRDWNSEWRNMWPEEARVPGFKRTMLDFYRVSPRCVRALVAVLA